MYWTDACSFSFWWLMPIIMMVVCFLVLRSRRGSLPWVCSPRDLCCRRRNRSVGLDRMIITPSESDDSKHDEQEVFHELHKY